MTDILFSAGEWRFSYRIAGLCINHDKILLSKASNDTGYSFPGGHVAFGETTAETIAREFREETGAEVTVGALRWVSEIFFPLKNKACHQICLFYDVILTDDTLASKERFLGQDTMDNKDFTLEFIWIPIRDLDRYQIYPPNAISLLQSNAHGIQHFVYRE